ncbi:hypothetical protein FRB97_003233 [Tulasnella sp. 331]|nr:hypothetical protein FRB97_003233 [Tulasnella sp. 331]
MSDYMSDDSDRYYYDDEDMHSERGMNAEDTPEESDDDYGGMEMSMNVSKPKRKVYEVEYDSMSTKDMNETMNKEAESLCGVLGVDISTAFLLLRHMQWNKEKLIDKCMEDSNKEMEAAGVPTAPPQITAAPKPKPMPTPTPFASTSALSKLTAARRSTRSSSARDPVAAPPPPPVEDEFMCPICCCEAVPPTGVMFLGCEHKFCTNCWSTYLTGKIREEGEHSIRCMEGGCNQVVPDTVILGTIKIEDGVDPLSLEDETKDKFKDLLLRYFVQCSAALRFCPAPSCDYAVSCPSASTKSSLETMVPTVKCENGHDFCFGCGEDSDHRPLICVVAKLWLKKCQDDSETANWIKSNTKECPKCQSTIEKNGGCNHMTCKKCKNEFCWVCMGPWSEHGNAWYSCNRYNETDGVNARDAQSKSRASLERYLHYYNRWANHEQSARLSLDLYAKTEKKMQEMQETSELTWIQVQFAKKAVDEVIKCRMTLKWTYAMGYYLEKGNQKELFEDNQRDLEKAVEALSELLERPIESDTVATLRQQITDKTVYVLKRNEVVLEDTANGFMEGRWAWNPDVSPFKR